MKRSELKALILECNKEITKEHNTVASIDKTNGEVVKATMYDGNVYYKDINTGKWNGGSNIEQAVKDFQDSESRDIVMEESSNNTVGTVMLTKDDFAGSSLDIWTEICDLLYQKGIIEHDEEPEMVEVAVLADNITIKL